MIRFRKFVLFLSLALLVAAYLWMTNKPLPPVVSTAADEASTDMAYDAVVGRREITESVETIATLVRGSELSEEVPDIFFQSLPGSLINTPKAAALGIDDNGDLIIDQRVRRLFEFYLMAMGEESLQHIVLRIQHDLNEQLDEPAYSQANELLAAYLQYRNHIGVINNQYAEQVGVSGASLSQLRDIKLAVRESRSEFLSNDVSMAFFSAEDEYDDYMMGRAIILTDKNLTADEKSQQLELHDLQSSRELVRSQQGSSQLSDVRAEVNRLRDDGATDNDVYAYREQLLGAEVAGRLAVLDGERQQWQTRVDDYRAELVTVESAQEYPVAERERMIEVLRAQHFDAQEILRIRVLDKHRGAVSN